MTHEEFVQIERAAGRALRTLASYTDNKDTHRLLRDAEYLLAEMRHASQYLCDPDEDQKVKDEAAARLIDVFTFQLH